jgi:hypothetical protein
MLAATILTASPIRSLNGWDHSVMALKRKTFWKALIASFSVYLLPVFTVHVFYLWGWAIGAEIFAGKSGREPLWLAADAGFAVLLQASAFVLFVWIFSGRAWRWLALVPAVPVFETVLTWVYLLVLPTYFLIEAQTAQEVGEWPVACRIEDATLLQVRQPAMPDLARAQEAWVGSTIAPGTWKLLSGPDCTLEATAHSRPSERGSLVSVAAGGAAIFTAYEGDPAVTRYWHLDPVSGAATELTPPPDSRYWVLALSRDGKAVGWLENRRVGQGFERWLKTREVASGRERAVLLQGLDRGQPEILALDGFEGHVMVSLYPGRILAFDARGARKWGPVETGGIDHIGKYFVQIEDGWVAWEIYREEGRMRLIWDLPAGTGRREVPKGSGITDLAVSADGALIAVSTTTNLNIGHVRDSLFVLRSRDSVEVYRRYLRKYTRTRMAFLGSRHLAVTRADLDKGGGWIEVLEVPEAVATE